MHSLFEKASGITHDVIGAAIEVHKEKGLGLLESIYEWCLSKELELRRHRVDNQEQVIVQWKQILHPLFPQPLLFSRAFSVSPQRSCFHRWVQAGVYPMNWACGDRDEVPTFDHTEKTVGE